MSTRLAAIAPELADQISQATHAQQKQIATHLALLAVDSVDLHDPVLDATVTALRENTPADVSAQDAVNRLTEQLDQIAWDLQERAEAGTASDDDYAIAFRRARAANTVAFALSDDAATAALETAYEAEAATEDIESVRAAVHGIINGAQNN
jgi:hypothetical protein